MTSFPLKKIEIRDLQTFKGLALQDILTEAHLYVHKSTLLFNVEIVTTVNFSSQ